MMLDQSDEEFEVKVGEEFKEHVFSGNKKIKEIKFNHPLSIKLAKLLKNGSIDAQTLHLYDEIKEILHSKDQSKTICAKKIKLGDQIIECFQCGSDRTCIICMDCYKNGNHQGHRIAIRKGGGGCCDCGDEEAWKKQGFCKKHSGQNTQTLISQEKIKSYLLLFQDIFYLYFRAIIEPMKTKDDFANLVFKTLCQINSKGISYNKLLTQVFNLKINKQTHTLNTAINEKTILQNILTYTLNRKYLKMWQGIFYEMFPDYQFKKLLLATYINSINDIYYNGLDGAIQAGVSISCQLLTSYKLVEDYVNTKGSTPIGANVILNQKNYHAMCGLVMHDLNYITTLQDDIPYKYWRFHIDHGLEKLFEYYQIQKKRYLKDQLELENKNNSQKVYMIKYCKQTQVEFGILQNLLKALSIIKHDKVYVLKMIKFAFESAILEQQDSSLPIFKPYERLLSVALFVYFDMDLDQILQNPQKKMKLLEFLKINEEIFHLHIHKLLKKAVQTYLYYGKILAGGSSYTSSFYSYLYFYQLKNRMMSSIDIIFVKILILIGNAQPIINFKQILEVQDNEVLADVNKLSNVLKQIRFLYVGNIAEIYLSTETEFNQNLYNKDCSAFLSKYLTEKEGVLSQQEAMDFGKTFLFDDQKKIKQKLKQICTFQKEKKQFTLISQFSDSKFINFNDFRTKFTNKITINNPQNTIQFIRTYNQELFKRINSEQTIKKLFNLSVQIIQLCKMQNENQNLIVLANDLSKIYYMLTHYEISTSKFIKELVLKKLFSIQEVFIAVDPFYQSIFKQKSKDNKNQNGQNAQTERKRILQQKKLKKMQNLKQKFKQNMEIVQNKESYRMIAEQQNEHKQYCVICRKTQDSDKFIYMTEMSIKNHEILLGIGSGVQTISFKCCYHIFHYSCIEEHTSEKSMAHSYFKCPVCKIKCNTYFPINIQSQLLKSSLQRITQVMYMMKDYSNLNAIEELIKSFYHYTLIGFYDFEYVFKRRRPIYQLILKILKQKAFIKEIEYFYDLFAKNKLNLVPKLMESEKKRDPYLQIRVQNDEDEWIDQDEEDDQYDDDEQDEDYDALQDMGDMDIEENEDMKQFADNLKCIRKSKSEKAERKWSFDNDHKMSEILKYTLERVFQHLLKKKSGIQIESEVHPYVIKVLDNLLENSEFKFQQFEKIEKKIEGLGHMLPKTYFFERQAMKCNECNEIPALLLLCLLCGWKGCANCNTNMLDNKLSGAKRHILKSHGQVSAFMELQKSMAYIISSELVVPVGYLYKNEWGDPFMINQDWKTYELDVKLLDEIRRKIINDE